MMDVEKIIEYEQRGLAFVRENNYEAAAELFAQIVAIHPDWEHGCAAYSLACALEEIGDLKGAEKNYLLALRCSPDDDYFIEGYASFLFLHGEPLHALDFFIQLIRREGSTQQSIDKRDYVLLTLAEKLNLSKENLIKRISQTAE